MPRAGDLFPDRRGGNDVHSPLRGLLDYTSPLAMTAQTVGEGIKAKIEDVVAFIKDTTGIDLTDWLGFLDGFEQATGLNLFELADLNPVDNIPKLIAALQGIDWTQPGAVRQAIDAAIEAVPFIGPALSALLGVAIPDDADPLAFAQRWGDNLRSFLPGVNLNLPTAQFDPQTALANFVNDGLRPLRLLLGFDDPLPAFNLFGSIRPNLFGLVPHTSIGDVSPNLVPDPTFQDQQSIDAIEGVDWDAAVGRTVAGSARMTAAGVKREILTDPATPVTEGQTIPFEAYARWQNLAGGTLPIQLGVARYDSNGNYLGTTVLAAIGGAGTQLAFQRIGTATDYTVPAGVAFVRQSVALMATATSGFVWIDDADHHKTQPLPRRIVDGLEGALEGLWSGIGEAGDDLQSLIETIAGGAGGLASIVTRLSKLNPLNGLIDAAGLGNIANIPKLPAARVGGVGDVDDIGTAVTTFLDQLVRGAGNVAGAGFSFADAFGVMRDLQSSIADANQAIAQLRSEQQGGSNSGNSASVVFSDYPDQVGIPMMVKVQDTGGGGVSTVGGVAQWADSGGSDSTETYLFSGPKPLTDYFETHMVMPSRPEAPPAFVGGSQGYTHLVGRSNAAGNTLVDAEIGYNTLRVGCLVNGVRTWFGAPTDYSTPAGSLVTFRGGTTGGVRVFQILVGNRPRATYVDNANVSQVGEAYRTPGLRFRAPDRAGGGQSTPGTVSAFAFNDNTPAPTLGVGLRVYRSLTSSTAQNNGSWAVMSANTMNAVDRRTPDIGWDSNLQLITIGTEGWYWVGGGITTEDVMGEGTDYAFGFIYTPVGGGAVNRVIDRKRPPRYASGGNGSMTVYEDFIGGNPTAMYFNVGDQLQLAWRGTAQTFGQTQGIVGDATGDATHFEVVLLNRSAA